MSEEFLVRDLAEKLISRHVIIQEIDLLVRLFIMEKFII